MKQYYYFVLALSILFLSCKNGEGDKKPSTDAEKGEHLAARLGCLGCHSTDGLRLYAPTFQNVYLRKVKLSDGREIIADEAYLKKSILEPQAEVVEGYLPKLMPKLAIVESDVDLLVVYLRTLKKDEK